MGSPFEHWMTLRDDFERVRFNFIRTDLDLCFTLATVAETEYRRGNREHAERTLATIEKGYSTLVRIFSQANGLTAEEEMELWSKFQQLAGRLEGLHLLR
jgi:hypothetical protein